MTRVDTPAEEQIVIEVPALVGEDLFEAAGEQLEENRKRKRTRTRGATYLLQGLIVCKGCGYACHGAAAAARTPDGEVAYAYYRCRGSEAWRYGGQKLCRTKGIRTDQLDAAVWQDVSALLSEPSRVREEYQRRREGPRGGEVREAGRVAKLINHVRTTISRLIDAYGDGLLDKSEFEPRIRAARERLSKLEEEHKQRAEEEDREAELRLVIGQLEEFASRVSEGLDSTNWPTRREIVLALVKRVEVDEEQVRIVYRVGPSPFEDRPRQGLLQHCRGRISSIRRTCSNSISGSGPTATRAMGAPPAGCRRIRPRSTPGRPPRSSGRRRGSPTMGCTTTSSRSPVPRGRTVPRGDGPARARPGRGPIPPARTTRRPGPPERSATTGDGPGGERATRPTTRSRRPRRRSTPRPGEKRRDGSPSGRQRRRGRSESDAAEGRPGAGPGEGLAAPQRALEAPAGRPRLRREPRAGDGVGEPGHPPSGDTGPQGFGGGSSLAGISAPATYLRGSPTGSCGTRSTI